MIYGSDRVRRAGQRVSVPLTCLLYYRISNENLCRHKRSCQQCAPRRWGDTPLSRHLSHGCADLAVLPVARCKSLSCRIVRHLRNARHRVAEDISREGSQRISRDWSMRVQSRTILFPVWKLIHTLIWNLYEILTTLKQFVKQFVIIIYQGLK